MASKGSKAHKQVDLANEWYRTAGIALVSYAGPQFTVTQHLPRGGFQGFMLPGPCDYIGHYDERPVRFDLKSTSNSRGMDLGKSRKSTPRQLKELAWCAEHAPKVLSGILVKRVQDWRDDWYWLPSWWLSEQLGWPDLIEPQGGLISWKKIEKAGLEVPCFDRWPDRPDYLETAEEWVR